jgi:hypothetical protein
MIEFDDGDVDLLEVLDELRIDEGGSYSAARAAPVGAVAHACAGSTVASSRRGSTVITLDRHEEARLVTLESPAAGAPPLVGFYPVGGGGGGECASLEALGGGRYAVPIPGGFLGLMSVEWR